MTLSAVCAPSIYVDRAQAERKSDQPFVCYGTPLGRRSALEAEAFSLHYCCESARLLSGGHLHGSFVELVLRLCPFLTHRSLW